MNLIVPDQRLFKPELLWPGRKPIGPVAQVPDESVVGRWLLQSGDGASDLSGNGRDGVFGLGVEWTPGGLDCGGGTTPITLPSLIEFTADDAYTIGIVAKQHNDSNSGMLFGDASVGNYFAVWAVSGIRFVGSGDNFDVPLPAALRTTTATYVVTYNPTGNGVGDVKIFRAGELMASASAGGAFTLSMFGNGYSTTDYALDGVMDRPFVLSRAMTEEEVWLLERAPYADLISTQPDILLSVSGTGNNITGTSDHLVITENTGAISTGNTVTGTTDNLVITENTGAISFGNLITGTTDPIIITEYPGTITLGTSITGTTDPLIITENQGTVIVGQPIKMVGKTEQITIKEHAGTVTLKRLATDGLHKLSSLRTHILELPASAGFKIDANNLITIIENGTIHSANGHCNQNFEWKYKAEIIIKNMSGNANIMIYWILQWLHKNQPNHTDEAIHFQADILNDNSADFGLTIELTEVVQVEQTEDGIQLLNPDSPDASVPTLPATDWTMTLNDGPPVAEWMQ